MPCANLSCMSNRYAQSIFVALWSIVLLVGPAWAEEDAVNPSPETQSASVESSPPQAAPTSQPTATQPAASPYTPGRKPFSLGEHSGDGAPNPLSELLAMVVVILLIGVVAWVVLKRLLPRWKIAGGQRKVRVLETTHLNPRQAVVLLEVGKRKLLVASTRERISMLADVTDGDEAAPADFAATLDEADRTLGRTDEETA